MAYQKPVRNSSGIAWQTLRESADLAAAEIDDEISTKYYDSWRHGISDPWGPFDGGEGGLVAHSLFTGLHSSVQYMHTIMAHKINHKMNQDGDPGVISQDEYRWEYDLQGNIIGDRVQRARDQLDNAMQELGVVSAKQMMDHYRLRTKELTNGKYDFPDFSMPPEQ